MQENENIVENLRDVFARNNAAARRERTIRLLGIVVIGCLIAIVWSWARC